LATDPVTDKSMLPPCPLKIAGRDFANISYQEPEGVEPVPAIAKREVFLKGQCHEIFCFRFFS
jgi:hypothetical protein